MPEAQRMILIDRPAGTVFAFFADPAIDQNWRPHLKEIAPPGPMKVGTTIRQVVAGPGGRGIPADIEVTAYEPPTRYAFKVTAAQPAASGSTGSPHPATPRR